MCGQGRPSDDHGHCRRCALVLHEGRTKGLVGTTLGSEKAWLEERKRGFGDDPVIPRRGDLDVELEELLEDSGA